LPKRVGGNTRYLTDFANRVAFIRKIVRHDT
jgi:hypothetical protein